MSRSPADDAVRHDESAGTPTVLALPAGPSDTDRQAAARLLTKLRAAWRRGRRLRVEEVVAEHAAVSPNREALLRLVCEEISLREEAGEEIASAEWTGRFPALGVEIRNFLGRRPPRLTAGDGALADFEILRELGRGAQGRVYLARQRSLGGRPVVLKVTGRGGREHLTLARLQHSHIAPLYGAHDDPDGDRRTLCMPYLGTLTLAGLLAALRTTPPGQRSGQDVLAVLDRAGAGSPVPLPPRGPSRPALERAAYAQAVAWVGACLADGLQYAHERGLVHLDVKPSNVLLAADATPMLLDFHLAREPLAAGARPTAGVGGTPSYMSPEQRSAVAAVGGRRAVPAAVDGRSDVYSLGVVLYQALGGPVPLPPRPPRLDRVNGQVSVGLADVVQRCLAADPAGRYRAAGALAADLRRHLADRPLRGVPNRSLSERWAKWRRRRPLALPVLALTALLLAGAAAVTLHLRKDSETRIQERLQRAEEALADGERSLRDGRYAAAAQLFGRGVELSADAPAGQLLRRLQEGQRRARQLESAHELHRLADALRLAALAERLPARQLRALAESCRALWEARDRLAPAAEVGPDDPVARRVRDDLLDLAVLRAELLPRLADGEDGRRAREEALAVLVEAERLFGSNAALLRARADLAAELGQADVAREAAARLTAAPPRTAWEQCALGRALLRAGDLPGAAAAFEQAVALEPAGYWGHFGQGTCAFRQDDYHGAEAAFRVCVALAPRSAAAWHNRGLAHERLGEEERALADYDRALELEPELAEAALNRAALRHRLGRHQQALADVRRALDAGADPASGHYLAGRIEAALGDRAAALASLRRALTARRGHPGPLALSRELQTK